MFQTFSRQYKAFQLWLSALLKPYPMAQVSWPGFKPTFCSWQHQSFGLTARPQQATNNNNVQHASYLKVNTEQVLENVRFPIFHEVRTRLNTPSFSLTHLTNYSQTKMVVFHLQLKMLFFPQFRLYPFQFVFHFS